MDPYHPAYHSSASEELPLSVALVARLELGYEAGGRANMEKAQDIAKGIAVSNC
jgi:hypothetical protein